MGCSKNVGTLKPNTVQRSTSGNTTHLLLISQDFPRRDLQRKKDYLALSAATGSGGQFASSKRYELQLLDSKPLFFSKKNEKILFFEASRYQWVKYCGN